MTNYFRIIKVIGRLVWSFKGKVIKWILKDSFTGGVVVGLCVANLHGTMEKSHLSSLATLSPFAQTHVNEENEHCSVTE